VSFSAPANFNNFSNSGFGLTCVVKKKNSMHQSCTKQNTIYTGWLPPPALNLIYKHTATLKPIHIKFFYFAKLNFKENNTNQTILNST